jgi:hypothetical protein
MEDEVNELMRGKPPYPDKKWTKQTLIKALTKLEGTQKIKAFAIKVVEVGKTDYKEHSGILKMYNNWKKTGSTPKRGRPKLLDLNTAESLAKANIKSRSSDSNAFLYTDMKNSYESVKKAKAASDGLDPNGVNIKVSDKTAKAAMVAIAMGDNGMRFTKKKLLTKTASRFCSEHSVMMGYAYATTVLSTHFIEGHGPTNHIANGNMEKLSFDAKETIEMIKEAYGADDIYPVNPNLILSTDDTTLFVFEGAKDSKEDDWEWKLVDTTNGDSSVRSDFQVGEDAANSGGMRVRLTFTFTASGKSAPPFIAVSGLTPEELSPVLCPDGILTAPVRGLCKGGDDLTNTGIGWLAFMRSDQKETEEDTEKANLSIANKKFMHYNDDVLLPFIKSIREKLGEKTGWKVGQPVPEWLTACSWFDGDIGQLQTMLFEAREALDDAERIIRNKHSAAATGTQQPCDLSPVFRLLKQLQLKSTAKDYVDVGLIDDIHNLFAVQLRKDGLNLGGNPRKKKALIDFLLCLPEMLESVLKKKNIKKAFVESGMIDKETGYFPVFDKLIGTCKRWVSASKDIGIPLTAKQHCKDQFSTLMKIQMREGGLSYPDMKEAGIPLGAFQ